MDNDEPTRWIHHKGDQYRVVIASAWMNDTGYGINYHPQPKSHPTLTAAIREGFTEHDRSDDFNVGVWRQEALVALLWMDEIVDDDPAVLAKVAA